jgi:hypothetical protein
VGMCKVCVSVQKSNLLEVYISDQEPGVPPTSSLGPFFFSVQVCEQPRGCRHTSLDVASLGLQCLHGCPQKVNQKSRVCLRACVSSEIRTWLRCMFQVKHPGLLFDVYVSCQQSGDCLKACARTISGDHFTHATNTITML